ncbi:MAG: hypothetical protein ACXVWU_05210 [Nocardioides sp.]
MADLLGIYLDDHLAALTGGAGLARRAARNQAARPWGPELATVASVLDSDRRALHELAVRLGTPAARPKAALAWAGERAGRLKLNGHLFSHSPLSDVTELEGLVLVTRLAAGCWHVLAEVATSDDRLDAEDLGTRLTRATELADQVMELHRREAPRRLLPTG